MTYTVTIKTDSKAFAEFRFLDQNTLSEREEGEEAARRSLGLLASKVSIDLVRLESNLTVMGASAMLLTAALGLELAR